MPQVWPAVRNETLQHDSFHCERWAGPHTRAWPTRRTTGPFNFVGSVGPMELTAKCPAHCRPALHQDWEHC